MKHDRTRRTRVECYLQWYSSLIRLLQSSVGSKAECSRGTCSFDDVCGARRFWSNLENWSISLRNLPHHRTDLKGESAQHHRAVELR
jgi:hypothetical protein